MWRLVSLVVRMRGIGWFNAPGAGIALPFPFTWQAWVLSASYVLGIAGSVFLSGEPAWLFRIGLTIGYAAIDYWTIDPATWRN